MYKDILESEDILAILKKLEDIPKESLQNRFDRAGLKEERGVSKREIFLGFLLYHFALEKIKNNPDLQKKLIIVAASYYHYYPALKHLINQSHTHITSIHHLFSKKEIDAIKKDLLFYIEIAKKYATPGYLSGAITCLYRKELTESLYYQKKIGKEEAYRDILLFSINAVIFVYAAKQLEAYSQNEISNAFGKGGINIFGISDIEKMKKLVYEEIYSPLSPAKKDLLPKEYFETQANNEKNIFLQQTRSPSKQSNIKEIEHLNPITSFSQ